MVPAGYILKRVVPPPAWLTVDPQHIAKVCSVSGCVSENLADPSKAWQHNSFGLANTPSLLWSLAEAQGVDLADAELFFCTAYEQEMESDGWTFDPAAWRPRTPDLSATVADAVAWPEGPFELLGYDVVVVEYGSFHSPLSCNHLASEIEVNAHCLMSRFEDAKEAIDAGRFGGGCEPGNYTVFAVHRIGLPAAG